MRGTVFYKGEVFCGNNKWQNKIIALKNSYTCGMTMITEWNIAAKK